ncbi:MAG: hypothetical protein Q8S31_05445 [Alphaproteobacteria bacterium]|nr:hypothetical protein [Alphaproteobacteria bacterium]
MLNRILFYFFFISLLSTSALMAGKSDEEDENFSNTHINDDSYHKKRKENPNIENKDIEQNPNKKIKIQDNEYEILEKIKDFCINFKDSKNIELKSHLLFNIIKIKGFYHCVKNNIQIKEYENYIETIILQLKKTFSHEKESIKILIRLLKTHILNSKFLKLNMTQNVNLINLGTYILNSNGDFTDTLFNYTDIHNNVICSIIDEFLKLDPDAQTAVITDIKSKEMDIYDLQSFFIILQKLIENGVDSNTSLKLLQEFYNFEGGNFSQFYDRFDLNIFALLPFKYFNLDEFRKNLANHYSLAKIHNDADFNNEMGENGIKAQYFIYHLITHLTKQQCLQNDHKITNNMPKTLKDKVTLLTTLLKYLSQNSINCDASEKIYSLWADLLYSANPNIIENITCNYILNNENIFSSEEIKDIKKLTSEFFTPKILNDEDCDLGTNVMLDIIEENILNNTDIDLEDLFEILYKEITDKRLTDKRSEFVLKRHLLNSHRDEYGQYFYFKEIETFFLENDTNLITKYSMPKSGLMCEILRTLATLKDQERPIVFQVIKKNIKKIEGVISLKYMKSIRNYLRNVAALKRNTGNIDISIKLLDALAHVQKSSPLELHLDNIYWNWIALLPIENFNLSNFLNIAKRQDIANDIENHQNNFDTLNTIIFPKILSESLLSSKTINQLKDISKIYVTHTNSTIFDFLSQVLSNNNVSQNDLDIQKQIAIICYYNKWVKLFFEKLINRKSRHTNIDEVIYILGHLHEIKDMFLSFNNDEAISEAIIDALVKYSISAPKKNNFNFREEMHKCINDSKLEHIDLLPISSERKNILRFLEIFLYMVQYNDDITKQDKGKLKLSFNKFNELKALQKPEALIRFSNLINAAIEKGKITSKKLIFYVDLICQCGLNNPTDLKTYTAFYDSEKKASTRINKLIKILLIQNNNDEFFQIAHEQNEKNNRTTPYYSFINIVSLLMFTNEDNENDENPIFSLDEAVKISKNIQNCLYDEDIISLTSNFPNDPDDPKDLDDPENYTPKNIKNFIILFSDYFKNKSHDKINLSLFSKHFFDIMLQLGPDDIATHIHMGDVINGYYPNMLQKLMDFIYIHSTSNNQKSEKKFLIDFFKHYLYGIVHHYGYTRYLFERQGYQLYSNYTIDNIINNVYIQNVLVYKVDQENLISRIFEDIEIIFNDNDENNYKKMLPYDRKNTLYFHLKMDNYFSFLKSLNFGTNPNTIYDDETKATIVDIFNKIIKELNDFEQNNLIL